MGDHSLGALLRRLQQQQLPGPPGEGPADADLLRLFAARRDGRAFELLLWRHGPMVLATCRRLLRHEQDAEDAFQATFLVLACKAASVRWRADVGNWLYAVAVRTARKAKAGAARRRRQEREILDRPASEPAGLLPA